MTTQHTQSQGQHSAGQFQLRRPSSLLACIRQVVLFLRDASSSVRGRKAREIEESTFSLVGELALPINRGGFRIGIIDFSNDAAWAYPITPAVDLNGRIRPMSVGGSTNITAAINLALAALQHPDGQGDPSVKVVRPVVITLSDGEHNVGASPESAADELRRVADHVTVGFGRSYDERLLRAIATSPQHHYRIKDNGKELRMFLAAVGQTLTKTLTQHVNATSALTQIQQV